MATEQELREAINSIESVETLRSIFQDVADALRRKGVEQALIVPSEFAGLIDSIEAGIDTFDADAEATDIANGKTAYVKGLKVKGNVSVLKKDANVSIGYVDTTSVSSSDLKLSKSFNVERLIRIGGIVDMYKPLADFGDAAVGDVISGKTFTSASGLKKTGTYTPPEPGTDTSDADATATDIANGKTAYVKGSKVIGSVPEVKADMIDQQGIISLSSPGLTDTRVTVENLLTFDRLFRAGSALQANVAGSEFGSATTADVLAGKTFTGASGLKKTGTLVPQTGTDISDATAVASDVASGKVFYGQNGRATGSLTVANSVSSQCTPQVSSSWLDLYYTMPSDQILRSGKQINLYFQSSLLGDATAADIVSGKTATSKNGLAITGTASLGTDTSSATAVASDIASGKTAYGASGKITGNVMELQKGQTYYTNYLSISKVGTALQAVGEIAGDRLFRKESTAIINIPLTNLGDATAADVASGKIFTSSAGLKVTGTMESGIVLPTATLYVRSVGYSLDAAYVTVSEYTTGVYRMMPMDVSIPSSDSYKTIFTNKMFPVLLYFPYLTSKGSPTITVTGATKNSDSDLDDGHEYGNYRFHQLGIIKPTSSTVYVNIQW